MYNRICNVCKDYLHVIISDGSFYILPAHNIM